MADRETLQNAPPNASIVPLGTAPQGVQDRSDPDEGVGTPAAGVQGNEASISTAPGRSPASAPALSGIGAPVPSKVPEAPEKVAPFGSSEVPSSPIPLPNFEERWKSGESGQGLTPRPNKWEEFLGGFGKGFHDTVFDTMARIMAEKNAPQGQTLSPDEANKAYPGRPVPYTTPVNENVARMEYNDRQKQAQLDEWMGRRGSSFGVRAAQVSGGLVGGLLDPFGIAIGALTGGVSELLTPEAAPAMAKLAAHYVGTWGGFSAIDATQNLLDHQMGARQKQFSEIARETAIPSLVMTGIVSTLGAAARRFSNAGEGAPEMMDRGVKEHVSALEQDKLPPRLEYQRALLEARRSGASGSAENIQPTLPTSPLQETKMYAATHSDGSPLIHQHGLGPGVQLTDSYNVANNGVSRSADVPGQIGEVKMPRGAKLLDIEQPAAEDYSAKDSFLKAVEEKTGVPLDVATKNGESIKDVLTTLSDFAGVDEVPADVMKQVQDLAKERGFSGYQLDGEKLGNLPTNRQAHLFSGEGSEFLGGYSADPTTTPQLPFPQGKEQLKGGQPAQNQNPALDKTQDPFHTPELEQLAHEYRKGKVFDPNSEQGILDAQKDIEQYKQQLTDLAKQSPSAAEALQDLKKQELHDTRMKDLVRRAIECGSGGGV